MLYPYICDDESCAHEENLEFSISEDQPKRAKCPKCGKKTFRRDWNSGKIIIPDHMKSLPDNTAPWDNKYGKFPNGVRGKYFKGGGV